MQDPKVEIAPARKINLPQSAKKADFVAMSPNREYVALTFPDCIQVYHIASSSKKDLETKVILTSGKKSGKFTAAAMSDSYIVAISEKEINTRPTSPLSLAPPDGEQASLGVTISYGLLFREMGG
ncbi:MAG: hypothetical protein Q9170_002057 [Blastenia crenularia]